MAQKNRHFGGLKNARNFSKFQQSKDIMKTGKSTSAVRFRVLPPFFRDAKKCHDEASAKADQTVDPTDSTVTSEKAQGPIGSVRQTAGRSFVLDRSSNGNVTRTTLPFTVEGAAIVL
jgi:hypothetical protein